MITHITILNSKDSTETVMIGKLDKAKLSQMKAHNDKESVLEASVEDLRQSEKMILAEYACGDVDERYVMTELSLIRRSLIAKGCKEYLRVIS